MSTVGWLLVSIIAGIICCVLAIVIKIFKEQLKANSILLAVIETGVVISLAVYVVAILKCLIFK